MRVDDQHKRCPRCGEVKPLTDFYRNVDRATQGVSGYCKSCTYASSHTPGGRQRENERRRRQRRERGLKKQPIVQIVDSKALCIRCQQWKPVEEMCKDSQRINGIRSWCKRCFNEYQQKRRNA